VFAAGDRNSDGHGEEKRCIVVDELFAVTDRCVEDDVLEVAIASSPISV
jgi:hypothetical protein